MKIQICFLLLSLYVIYSLALDDEHVSTLWNTFKKAHGKRYLYPEIEEARFTLFKKNLDIIETHNVEYAAGLHSYTLGMNLFADWTFDEFQHRFLGQKSKLNRTIPILKFQSSIANKNLPEEVDWRNEAVVSDVKNQDRCSTCSFSTTGAVEGAYARATGKLVSLREQQLVDCNAAYGNECGCDHGLMVNAFKYIIEKQNLYVVVDECPFKKENVVATIKSFVDIPSQDEQGLKEALATAGPVSVAIDVTKEKFMLYKEGIFVDPTCSNDVDKLNHGVLVVGYGRRDADHSKTLKDDEAEYWIVKNSWSPTWGEQGYIRMARNKNNMCGIATSASYPVV